MTVTTPKHKRNRLLVVLMLPALAIIWLVGWSLYWIGRQKDAKPGLQPKREIKHEVKREESNVTLIVAPTFTQDTEDEQEEELSA